MAGERSGRQYREVSAVCPHPDFQAAGSRAACTMIGSDGSRAVDVPACMDANRRAREMYGAWVFAAAGVGARDVARATEIRTPLESMSSTASPIDSPFGRARRATPANVPRKLDDRRMSNVYALAHAGAILDICLASPDAAAFPEAKSREIGDLATRLAAVVRSIGAHFRDTELVSIYDATKANMAADTKLRFHVKSTTSTAASARWARCAPMGRERGAHGNYLEGNARRPAEEVGGAPRRRVERHSP